MKIIPAAFMREEAWPYNFPGHGFSRPAFNRPHTLYFYAPRFFDIGSILLELRLASNEVALPLRRDLKLLRYSVREYA